MNAIYLYGHSMSQPLPYDEIKFGRNVCSKEIIITPDNSDIGFFLEVDLSYPYKIRQKTEHFHFAPENKISDPDYFTPYMKKIKPKNYTKTKKKL